MFSEETLLYVVELLEPTVTSVPHAVNTVAPTKIHL